jgi:hypothetical protein
MQTGGDDIQGGRRVVRSERFLPPASALGTSALVQLALVPI